MTRVATLLGAVLCAGLLVVGGTGSAWATLTGVSSAGQPVSTLTLTPPTKIVRTGCASTGTLQQGRTLSVGFAPSDAQAAVDARPATTPAQSLTYEVTVVISGIVGGGTASGTLGAGSTGFTVTTGSGGSHTWAVSTTTRYATWSSTTATVTLTC